MVDHRAAEQARRPRGPAARRLRLHDGAPDREGVRRQPGPDHLRRHDRDPEGDHRSLPRDLTPMFGRHANLRRIEALDPGTDFDEIFRLVTRYEFPWDYNQGTAIAFMRDYGIPSISALLDRTKQFEEHGQKRYDDTILIGFEAVADTLESSRGRATMRHLNKIHDRFD